MFTPAVPPTVHLVGLSNQTLLLIRGPDASKFLQGQVTCDIKELSQQVTRLGAQCNPKGRVLLSFRALQMDSETIALRLPANMMSSALNTLGKYIVFSKAKLHDAHNDFVIMGLFGESAHKVAAVFFDQLPAGDDAWITKDGSYLIQLAPDRFECWIPSSELDTFLAAVGSQTQNAAINDWQQLDIAAGIAEVYPETFELFTPQELNYQLVNAINFRKGCYTGQEIVARLHYRGKLKRHMYRCEYKAHELPLPGTPVINSSSGHTMGAVVMATTSNEGKIELLASLLDEALDEAQVESATEKLGRLDLPYAIPTADGTLQ
jgi:hypothetical protein